MPVFDEREFIARLESANTDQLLYLLTRPTADEERALRAHLGNERYQRLHGAALKRSASRGVRQPRGNVVVIHGIMGSDLSVVDRTGGSTHLWVNALRIATGWLDRLRLDDSGLKEYGREYDVRATGIMKRHYGELLLSLSETWDVRAFWFDWRKDLNLAAAGLEAQTRSWFGDSPFHIVAHSMGGLVARTFIKRYPERWRGRPAESRLVMLGTPNHGSFVIPQVITGLEHMLKMLTLLDLRHSTTDLLTILNSFPGSYQMLPSPIRMPSMEQLYESRTYASLNVPQCHLDNARRHHELLSDVVDPERMIFIAGHNQPTFSTINDLAKLSSPEAYDLTMLGDGRVPHELGRLDGVSTYYVEENHGNLASNTRIIGALEELLETGATQGLDTSVPASRAAKGKDEASTAAAREQLRVAQAADETRLREFVRRQGSRSAEPGASAYLTSEERQVEDSLTRNFLSYREDAERTSDARDVPFDPARIGIGLVHGRIEEPDKIAALNVEGALPVDAIAVGHYVGVRPQAAELALDRCISRALLERAHKPLPPDGKIRTADLVLTQYTERGTLRGELGQPFFLADPRCEGRVIAIAGMGLPGRFGVPELTVLARELCWSLGRMGKRHLATVLIGAGNGNLPEREAIDAWIRGVKHAITGSKEEEGRHLARISFVELDPGKMESIEKVILEIKSRLEAQRRLEISYDPRGPEEFQRLRQESGRRDLEAAKQRQEGVSARRADIPTRITLGLEHQSYRFGAITATAAIPEREIPLDPTLVDRANDELAAETSPSMQLERGRFLERLLVPDDLRAQLSGSAPVVMLLDAATARIHWEMVAQPDPTLASDELSEDGTGEANRDGGGGQPFEFESHFLGTCRGFTRQLRTLFAPPPEPPPPPRRILRVLVVADPAEDARLPGAEEEGVEVADLFESFNAAYGGVSDSRVQVVRLFGPREATRTNVLRHLILRSYDVLHFAGHCMYEKDNPPVSGWIFTGGERLSANELRRIDRIPKFVFSNACESGITPDRSEKRSADLAPSFAEQFFARGVSNFVCTAWPVNDVAARDFALTLYANLLGLRRRQEGLGPYERTNEPTAMHVAMRAARLRIAGTAHGARTWGAYQHYGSPTLQFFDPATLVRSEATPEPAVESVPSGQPRNDGAPE